MVAATGGARARRVPGSGALEALWGEERAQGTVEYAMVTVALLAIVVALALLWRAGEEGVLVGLAQDAASHQLDGTGALDIALY